MCIPLLARIKGFFVRDKYSYWWKYVTDEEKQLRRMDVWQLAEVIREARSKSPTSEAEKIIVAEYMLSERLARIQARPAYFSIFAGIIGIVVGAFLTSALQSNDKHECVCECKSSEARSAVNE